MPSRFGWVDFAEEDRQKMLDVVQLFRERDTRDELGIGTIRDAFADHFFPGTSTIQTRARYMLFVPWVYLDLERKRIPSAKIAARARRDEIRLITALLAAGETHGVIGQDARGSLQRLPSNTYWSGLGSWGIRLFPDSQSRYHRHLDVFYRLRKSQSFDDNGEPIGGPPRRNWDPGLPQPPDDLYARAEMRLSHEEAAYLQDRILIRHRESLLAKLVQADQACEGVGFPWEHPIIGSLPSMLRQEIRQGRNFSEVIHGAALLYNLLLARARGHDEWVGQYEERLGDWATLLKDRDAKLRRWYDSRSAFWKIRPFEHARISHPTRAFVGKWLELVFKGAKPDDVVENRAAHALIRARESRLKGKRARLENPRALEMWRGASGDRQLDYRWANVSVIVADIVGGLGTE